MRNPRDYSTAVSDRLGPRLQGSLQKFFPREYRTGFRKRFGAVDRGGKEALIEKLVDRRGRSTRPALAQAPDTSGRHRMQDALRDVRE